ncbi:MAG: hypothetical protein OXU75_21375 [Deltaproteobacteria bacterium]|nr:hypothetical protein [Deltaproteobacteria bacterium]
MTTVLHIGQIDVTNALAELGVRHDILEQAVLAGEHSRNECTWADPPNTPGFIAWARTLRRLKELLVREGWTGNDYAVLRPDGRLAISVTTGDEAAGNPDRTPKTKYPKGASTEVAIQRNRRQLNLFDPASNREILEGPRPDEVQTWMLVRRRVNDTVFLELSLPSDLGEDGRVEEWGARIILGPVALEPEPMPGQGDSQAIEIDIRRRS